MIFHTGDVVTYVGDTSYWDKKGEVHIISECSYLGKGKFEYATDKGAWFQEKDFLLVSRANAASFAELDKALDAESEEEFE